MEKQFVTYEIAIQLKELGFNEKCLLNNSGKHLFIGTGQANFKYKFENNYEPFLENGSYHPLYHIPIPLWQQVIDWLREKHNLMISLKFEIDKWNWHISSDIKFMDIWVHGYKRYEEAREQAILKAIELCKQN